MICIESGITAFETHRPRECNFSNCFKKIYSQREEWLKLNNECTLKMAKQMGKNHLKMTKMGRMSNLFINGCVLVVWRTDVACTFEIERRKKPQTEACCSFGIFCCGFHKSLFAWLRLMGKLQSLCLLCAYIRH